MGSGFQHQKTKSNMLNTIKDIIFSLLNRQTINLITSESLSDKVIVITGASQGIGAAAAEVLLAKGASLALLSRDIIKIKKRFSKYNQSKLILLKCDVKSQTEVSNALNNIINRFGKVDVLINNAGIFKDDYLEKVSLKDFEDIISTNIVAVYSLSKAVIPAFKAQKSGLIINMGSRISRNTNIQAERVLYATSKFAVEGFSKALNNELNPWGIRVTCLMPGTVNTFRSPTPQKYLQPYEIGQIISLIIEQKNVDFEGIVFKSKYD